MPPPPGVIMQHQVGDNHGIQRDAAAPRHIAQDDDEARRALQEIERHGRRAARFQDARLRTHPLQRHRLPAAQGGEERQAVTGRRHCRAPRGDQDLRRFQPGLLPRAARQGSDAAQPRYQRDFHRHDRHLARELGERTGQARARGPEAARPDLVPARRLAPFHERDQGPEEQALDPDVRDRRRRAERRVHERIDARDRGGGRDAATTRDAESGAVTRLISPPWIRRGGAKRRGGSMFAALPPHRLRRHPSSMRRGKIGIAMEFGVFDHLDLGDRPHEQFYRERLEIVEAYERAGFTSYHVAEHHLTPLGMAPSPSVFLAAVAQRTKRLRFGPMVTVAPLYHPLRLVEEICMLDQLSGGRLEMAFGRGALEAELRFYDVDPAQSEKAFQEIVGFVLEGLREGAVTVSEEGGKKRRLALAIPPLQKPHPPLWYGIHSPQAAERAARLGMNVMGLDGASQLRACADRFAAVWRETHGGAPLPKIGLGRFVVVGKNANDARAAARRAYKRWYESFTFLSSLMGVSHRHSRPPEFEAIAEDGRAFAGDPEGVAGYVRAQLEEAGANYFVR